MSHECPQSNGISKPHASNPYSNQQTRANNTLNAVHIPSGIGNKVSPLDVYIPRSGMRDTFGFRSTTDYPSNDVFSLPIPQSNRYSFFTPSLVPSSLLHSLSFSAVSNMQYHAVSQLLLAALFAWTSDGQLITITRTHSICAASSSVLSSSSPSPPPLSSSVIMSSTSSIVSMATTSPGSVDQQIDAGASFTIQILPVTLPKGRRDPRTEYWLTDTGLLSPDQSLAAIFTLKSGQLLADGLIESTSPNIPNQVFAASPRGSEGSISTQFTVNQGVVTWIFPTFDGGAATFYQGIAPQDSPSKRQNGQTALFARFNGPVDQSWSPVSLGAGRKYFHLFLRLN
jgi:hypothetical protein